ncbi:MAG: class I SAM-dependent methyltransferase, partial [Chitinophagaceae bacterium]
RQIAQNKGIRLIEESNILESYTFDAISMWHVLEHVPSPEAQVKELKRLLKKDGTIFIAVPNFRSYDAQHYKTFWAAYDVPRHLWHFSKPGIEKLFASEGMKVVNVLPMKFDAYYVSLLSEKYKTGKMNYLSAFFVGWRSNLKASR